MRLYEWATSSSPINSFTMKQALETAIAVGKKILPKNLRRREVISALVSSLSPSSKKSCI